MSGTVEKQMFFGKRYKQSIGKLRAIIPQEVAGGAFRNETGTSNQAKRVWEKIKGNYLRYIHEVSGEVLT